MQKINFNPVHVLKPEEYKPKVTPAVAQEKFSDSLKNAIANVNKTQIESNKATMQFIDGKIDNIHDVMIAAQKASVTRTAAITVRDKVVEAYKEIMRMPL